MYLTNKDLAKVANFNYILKIINGNRSFVLTDTTQCMRFWYIFMKDIFAPKFQAQGAVPNLPKFDQTQLVVIDATTYELTMDPIYNTVWDYSEGLPFQVNTKISAWLVCIIFIIICIALTVFAKFFMDKGSTPSTFVYLI